MGNNVELADVIGRFGKEFIEQETLSPGQIKALYHILHCRTATLGGHEEACTCCGEIRYSYNSCGDRHCTTLLCRSGYAKAMNAREQNKPCG